MCALKFIWFNEIDVCVSWNVVHHLNETTWMTKCIIKVVIREMYPKDQNKLGEYWIVKQ